MRGVGGKKGEGVEGRGRRKREGGGREREEEGRGRRKGEGKGKVKGNGEWEEDDRKGGWGKGRVEMDLLYSFVLLPQNSWSSLQHSLLCMYTT